MPINILMPALSPTMKKGNLITVRVTAIKPGYASAALVSLPAKVR